MKYCVPYSKRFKYMSEIDETILMFDKEHNSDILKVMQLNKDEDYLQNIRLIIGVLDIEYFKEVNFIAGFLELHEQAPQLNLSIMFDHYSEDLDPYIEQLKDYLIPFFFGTMANTWDTFNGLIKLGVSDVYVTDELGFQLNLLGPVAHAAGVSIRVFANICQSSWDQTDSLKSFFIRPEAVILYDSYVDVIEFIAENTIQQEVFYRVYSKEKKWFGNLQEIIQGMKEPLDSKCVVKEFDAARIKCGKRCVKGGKCAICDRVVQLAKTLDDNDLYIPY